ncbi:MAG: hypothetical protein KGI45_04340 [Patescibacteria group bacterium]|nr:hypothetical protein [Patescibacteria group bacterium]MDE1967262.1 hypothetical protein [Patescibacteria group bacterium]
MFRNRYHQHGPPRLVVGLVAASVGAAASYFLFGTETGAEKRAKAKEWLADMKDSATSASGTLSELASVGKEMTKDMASLIKDRYSELKDLDKDEVSDLADRLRAHWAEALTEMKGILDEAGDDEG